MLGVGVYDAVITDRGGVSRIGPLSDVLRMTARWQRDDIGTADVRVAVTPETEEFLSDLRTGRHELVLYRNGVRVFEGPLTRLNYTRTELQITASDVAWYLSRRALQYDYDRRYPNQGSAVRLCEKVMEDHYPSSGDPFNIGQYVTVLETGEDARTASLHAAGSKTVWELIDQLAQNGGLDYVVRGRRIVISDTNTRMHVSPQMWNEDFASDLEVVEYGSELCTRYYTANNRGATGVAIADSRWLDYYGYIDKVSNADTEEEGEDEQQPFAELAAQAKRALEVSYPSPVDILVPSNSLVVPGSASEFTDLLPGSWVPVQSTLTPRKVLQWQRINTTYVTYDQSKEELRVSMSKAPNNFVDPT